MTQFDHLVINTSLNSIASINKTYEGDLVVQRKYGETTIEAIDDSACSNGKLKSLDLSNTVITSIAGYAFVYCNNLKTVKFPETLLSLGFNSFGVTGLTEFHLPKNVKSFSGPVVNQSPALDVLTVDEENQFFASYKNFIFNKGFTKLIRAPINFQFYDIPYFEKIQQISTFAFSGCKMKTFIATANLSYIEGSSFHACSKLRLVDFSLSYIKTMPNSVFWGSPNIETLILPRNLEAFAESSLQSMKKLKELIIPETVKSIATKTITELSQLKDVYVLCSYSSGFEDKKIFNSYSDTVSQTKVHVHVSNSYFNSCDKFGGFTVTNDLSSALNTRMKRRLICTKRASRSRSLMPSTFLFVFIFRY